MHGTAYRNGIRSKEMQQIPEEKKTQPAAWSGSVRKETSPAVTPSHPSQIGVQQHNISFIAKHICLGPRAEIRMALHRMSLVLLEVPDEWRPVLRMCFT